MKKTVNQNLNSISASGVNSEDQSIELKVIKETLLIQKSEILNRNLEFKSSQEEIVKCSDEADSTAQELQNNVSIQLHERERKSLILIEKALAKFVDNSYGLCEMCGDDIHIKRLQARPLATFCIACMEETEKPNRASAYLQ